MAPRIIESVAEIRQLVGQEVGVSDWLVVSQAMIDAFSEVTGDRQWIHVDGERAKSESPYGTTIAHGFLTLALVTRLQSQVVQIRAGFERAINYGLNRVRFPAPVRAGSRIRARSTLEALEDFPQGIQLTWAITVENDSESKPALVAECIGRLYYSPTVNFP
jgi:acyl dehydratase